MIVRMAKVMLTGPKEKFLEVLTLVQHLGVMHIDPFPPAQHCLTIDQYLSRSSSEQEVVEEGLFLERLRRQINELTGLFGAREAKPSHISAETALLSLPRLIAEHTHRCASWSAEYQRLTQRLRSLSRYLSLLRAVEELIPDPAGFAALDAVGVVIADSEAFTELLTRLQDEGDIFLEVKILEREGEERIGLLIAERGAAKRLHDTLKRHGVAELESPEESLTGLPWAERRAAIEQLIASCEQQLGETNGRLTAFARQWGGIYHNLGQWINERLAVLNASTSICETALCFILVGWIPAADLPRLERKVTEHFGNAVLVEETEVFEHDLEKIPIALQNPPYFRPFEIFSRLLPLPRYSSFDITPFLGIFFPVFFGLMLGDVGYGAVLLVLAATVHCRSLGHRDPEDAAKIMAVSACYTIIFGALYGECFGELGHLYLGLPEGVINRRTALVPMFFFSLALGVVHVVLGLVLGVLSAVKRGHKKEALFKLFSILIIFFLLTAGLLSRGTEHGMSGKFFVIALVSISGVLLVSGGVLAPLEVLKHFGNIISYARIMAIGLTSVLLAEVANQLAGMMGSLWVGILVAVLLHTFNILLGIFAPTIHSLRLHYVEFFSKFMEEGGKAFKPLNKGPGK